MRKYGGTPSRRDKHVTPAAISPPGVARGRFVGGQQSGVAGCIDGSTSSPGCSVINENPGLFKFWADPVKPWITNKGPKAAIWSRGKRNNHAVNLFA